MVLRIQNISSDAAVDLDIDSILRTYRRRYHFEEVGLSENQSKKDVIRHHFWWNEQRRELGLNELDLNDGYFAELTAVTSEEPSLEHRTMFSFNSGEVKSFIVYFK